jgi:riboflavin synthase
MVLILDPTDERVPVQRQLARRPEQITGTVGLLDISKPRGNVFLDRLQELLKEQLPEVKINRYRKPTFAKPAPEALRRQIREECDFVIEALAD